MNDFRDREVDVISHPSRPLPSGKMRPASALGLAILALTSALLISIGINQLCLLITSIALILQLSYEALLKKIALVGNAVIAGNTALAFLFGGAAVGSISSSAILALLAFLSILGREIVKSVEDIKGEEQQRKTLPVRFGVRGSLALSSILVALAIAASPFPYYPMQVMGLNYLIFVLPADALFVYSIWLQYHEPGAARRSLKVAMLLGLFAFIFGRLL